MSVTVTESSSTVAVVVTEGSVVVGGPTSTQHNALPGRSAADAHPTSAITGLDAALAAKQPLEPITVSGSATATLNRLHIVVATATLTDPSPSEGRGYEVIVRNGTATVGGTAYPAGTIIWRLYHSGSWRSYPAPASYAADHTLTIVTPTSGSSITVPDDVSAYLLTPAATLATLTVTFPANPYTRQMLTISAGSFGVTALTMSANTGKSFATGAALTAIAASGFAKYLFNANVWYRVG